MRISLIGLGSMGRNHYRLLRSFPDVELISVCDPVLNNGLPEPAYPSLEGLLADPGACRPDGVVVAVPTIQHRDIALRLAEEHIPFLLEKPLAATVADGV